VDQGGVEFANPLRRALRFRGGPEFALLAAQQFEREERHEGERADRRERHRQRHVDRHRRHVGPHHPGDEEHRQERNDDCDGGHDDRRQHLLHRFERRFEGFLAPQPDVPLDVVHVGDGVVHHQPEAEDQREQRHPVESEPEDVIGHQRQRKADRHRDADHQAFAPAHGERDEQNHGDDRKEHALDQPVDPFVRRLALVAGHGHFYVGGDDASFGRVGRGDDLFCQPHRVDSRLLAEGERHRRFAVAADVILRLRGRVENVGNVGDADDPAVVGANDDLAHLFRRSRNRPGHQQHLLAAGEAFAHRGGGVGALHRVADFGEAHLKGGEILDARLDADHPLIAAVNAHPRNVRNGVEPGGKFLGHPPQPGGIVLAVLRGKRNRDNRHIVDADRDHPPAGHPGGDDVAVFLDLVAQPDHGAVAVLADVEAHRHQRAVAAAHRVDVLAAVELPEQPLQRACNKLFDLLGRVAGIGDLDIGHRHDDLGVFFARSGQQSHDSGDNSGGDENSGQRPSQKEPDNTHDHGGNLPVRHYIKIYRRIPSIQQEEAEKSAFQVNHD